MDKEKQLKKIERVYTSLNKSMAYKDVKRVKGVEHTSVPYADNESIVFRFTFKSTPLYLVFDKGVTGDFWTVWLVSKLSSRGKLGSWNFEDFTLKAMTQRFREIGIL